MLEFKKQRWSIDSSWFEVDFPVTGDDPVWALYVRAGLEAETKFAAAQGAGKTPEAEPEGEPKLELRIDLTGLLPRLRNWHGLTGLNVQVDSAKLDAAEYVGVAGTVRGPGFRLAEQPPGKRRVQGWRSEQFHLRIHQRDGVMFTVELEADLESDPTAAVPAPKNARATFYLLDLVQMGHFALILPPDIADPVAHARAQVRKFTGVDSFSPGQILPLREAEPGIQSGNGPVKALHVSLYGPVVPGK